MSLNSFENGTAQDSVQIIGNLMVQSEPGQASLSSTSLDSGAITTDGAGNITRMGYISPNAIYGAQSATAFVVASGGGAGGTIPTAGASAGLVESRVAPAGAVTGAILQAGTKAGQIVVVVNESAAASTVTFAAAGTSNVAGGTTVSLAGLAAHMFIWDSVTALWYQIGPAIN